MFNVIIYTLVISLFFKNCVIAQIEGEENCETLQSEIHIAKGINFDQTIFFS